MNENVPPPPSLLSRRFALVADRGARLTGHPLTFMFFSAAIVLWTIVSVAFNLSNGWQSLINTVTTAVTFLMVFLIQSTQNRGDAAVQAKLDELIRALETANNQFIGIENRTINEVHELRQETVNEVKKLDELISDVESERDEAAHHANDDATHAAKPSKPLE